MDRRRVEIVQRAESTSSAGQTAIKGYVIKDRLGVGSTCEVFLAHKKSSKYAIKIYDMKHLSETQNYEKHKELIINELEALESLDHPNIMKIHEHFSSNNRLYLVLQHCEQGDLLSWISENGWLTEKQVLDFLPPLVSAFEQAASLKIMHRDVKPENLFLTDGGRRVVLGDFGFAKVGSEFTSTILGTKPFMAPEVHQGLYSFGAEVWALGVTLYMSMFGHDPWNRSFYQKTGQGNQLVLRGAIKFNGPVDESTTGMKLRYPENKKVSDHLKNILGLMLQIDVNKRIDWAFLAKLLRNPSEIPPKSLSQLGTISSGIGSKNIPMEQQIRSSAADEHKIKKLIECSEVINQTKFSSDESFSKIMDSELSKINIIDNSDMIECTKLPDCSPQDVRKEVIERYIMYNHYMCTFHKVVVEIFLDTINSHNQFKNQKGAIYLAVNIIAKKSRKIAAYFIQKLETETAAFTEIGKCTDFYQNNFAKQFYLDSFWGFFREAEEIIKQSAIEAQKHLSESFYNKELQLKWANEVDTFNKQVKEGLYLAGFVLFKSIDKVDKTMLLRMKRWLTFLTIICRYEDRIIFDADQDQHLLFSKMLKESQDVNSMEKLFDENKNFFREWMIEYNKKN